MDVAEAVAAPRLHHQWMPDEVLAESGVAAEILRALAARGHAIRTGLLPTSANSIQVDNDRLIGAADPRTRGALAAGH
jgi:gamma-glutamyltranspeptidase/glutathione hydrolase